MKTIKLSQKISFVAAVFGVVTLAAADDATMTNNLTAGQANPGRPMNSASNQPPTFVERVWGKITAQEFVTDAAMGGMKEIQASQLALSNSQNQSVKDFAHRMITDHSQANAKLMALAQQKGLNLPGTNTFATDDPAWNNPLVIGSEPIKDAYLLKTNLALVSYQDIRQLKGLSGRDFDLAYARTMVMDHINTVAEFEAADRVLTDPDLKNFAEQTLPTLREHRQMARKLANELNGTPAGSQVQNDEMENSRTAANAQH